MAAAIILAAPVLILSLAPAAAQAQVVASNAIDEENEAAADAILRAMSDYLGKTRNVTFDYSSDVEVISQGGQSSLSGLKLQFGSHGSVAMSRPDKLRASRTGGYSDIEIVTDGRTVSVAGKGTNTYAQGPASPSLDRFYDDFRNLTGADFPGADLLFSDVYSQLSDPVQQAFYIGAEDVEGIPADHLAFRTADVDWQIWVQKGPKPIPLKYIVTSKWITGAPQYQLRVRNWNDNPTLTPATFAFKPAAGAKSIDMNELTGIGDVPLPIAIGGRK